MLIIDDSSSARLEIRAVLESSRLFARILEAVDGFAGLRMLLAEPIDAVICDLEMPGLTARSCCGRSVRDPTDSMFRSSS